MIKIDFRVCFRLYLHFLKKRDYITYLIVQYIPQRENEENRLRRRLNYLVFPNS